MTDEAIAPIKALAEAVESVYAEVAARSMEPIALPIGAKGKSDTNHVPIPKKAFRSYYAQNTPGAIHSDDLDISIVVPPKGVI